MNDTNNLITVFADASFMDGDAGYAIWCRGQGGSRYHASQPITWTCEHIGEAETVALATAIISGIAHLPLRYGGVIVAQSDSLRTLDLFASMGAIPSVGKSDRPIRPNPNGSPTQIVFAYDAMLHAQAIGAKVYLKHIKAHTGSGDTRSRVNEWCDRHAKVARRAAYKRRAEMETRVEQAIAQMPLVPTEIHQFQQRIAASVELLTGAQL